MAVGEKSAIFSVAPDLVTSSLCPEFSVTVLASRRNLSAAPPRVKRVVSPLDPRVLSHAVPTSAAANSTLWVDYLARITTDQLSVETSTKPLQARNSESGGVGIWVLREVLNRHVRPVSLQVLRH